MKKHPLPTPARLLKRAVSLAVPCLVALALPGRAAEGDSDLFRFFKMEFPGSSHGRIVHDVNGDGMADLNIIVSRSDQRDTYWLKTCLEDAGGGFSGKCSDLKLKDSVRAFAIGELDGKPGAELLLITDSDVEVSSFGGGRFGAPQTIITDRTLFSGSEAELPVKFLCLWDLDVDGKEEIILPTMGGPVIYRHSESGFVKSQQINAPARVTYRVGSLGDITATDDVNQFLRWRQYEKRVTAHFTAPDVFVDDFNGDKKPDLITLINNTLTVFPQGPDGRFADQPAVNEKRSILPPEERGVGFSGEAMTYSDLNGDGMGDLIMMKWGSSQDRTQMDRYLYFARPGLKYPKEPDQIVRSESAALDFGIYDLNNDRKNDLIIPFFHFAPAQAFKVMTENAIKIQFRLFLMGPDGRYSQDPGNPYAKVDRRVVVNYKIDVLGMIFDFKSLLAGKFHPLISFGRDFNGDGYGDLVADTGDDKLNIFWGNKDVKYDQSPDVSLDFESAMTFDLADLNGDGKMDIVAYYESEARTQKKREIAKQARQKGTSAPSDYELEETAALAQIPEGARIKVLLSK